MSLTSPNVVNGKLVHEKKYADVLKTMYPSATLVLVKIDASWLWSSQAARVSESPFSASDGAAK